MKYTTSTEKGSKIDHGDKVDKICDCLREISSDETNLCCGGGVPRYHPVSNRFDLSRLIYPSRIIAS